jgi:two-component system, cell cycle sensor histidine kinase and response regulator CckA
MTILEELPTGVWVAHAPGGELAYANRIFAEILGVPARGDVADGQYTQTYHLLDRSGAPYPETGLPFARVLRERRMVVVDDIVIARPDGSRVNVRAIGKPLIDDRTGQISLVMIVFTDITAEVRAESDVAAARERLRTAVDHAPIILFGTDLEGIITVSEGAGLRGMGVKPGELVGKSVFDLYRDHPGVLANTRRVLQKGETFTSVNEVGAVVLESWMAPLNDAGGELVGLIGVSTDVTERLRLERQMTQADRLSALGRLAASVAHEINNPLAYTMEAIRLASETVSELEASSGPGALEEVARLRRLLAEATEGAERVRLITRDLKAFSRADEDARRPLDLNATVATAVKLVGKRTGTRAQVDLALGPPATVCADENRLVQIFVNLLLNAADAMPARAPADNRIRISSRVEGANAVVEVADNGPGIMPAVRARIFEPFYTTKPVGEGTGLGLFVTRNLVDALGGSITVGDAPEGGALFSVSLPTVRPADAEEAKVAASPRRDAGRWRVLIIDDDPQVAKLLRLSLEHDCDVEMFTSGTSALDHLAGGATYDLVFCDLMMAELSGMSLYQELQRRAPGRERAVVFMTGGVYDPSVSDFLAGIPNDCVDKPFDIRAEVHRRLA